MEAPPLIKKTYKIISEKNHLFNIEISSNHNSISIYIYAYFQGEIIKDEYEKKFTDTELKMNK